MSEGKDRWVSGVTDEQFSIWLKGQLHREEPWNEDKTPVGPLVRRICELADIKPGKRLRGWDNNWKLIDFWEILKCAKDTEGADLRGLYAAWVEWLVKAQGQEYLVDYLNTSMTTILQYSQRHTANLEGNLGPDLDVCACSACVLASYAVSDAVALGLWEQRKGSPSLKVVK